MSDKTDARSRPGARLNTGTDDRELFMVEFGELVLTAWEETNDYASTTYTRTITKGKSDTFPIIGRKRDAQEHAPGEEVLGGTMEHNEVEITLDKILVDSVFIAEIDELMLHYDIRAPYAQQLGESLATASDRRVARMHILASRVTDRPYGRNETDPMKKGPLPNGYFHNDLKTDVSKMEEAHFEAMEWIKRFDIGGGPLFSKWGWAQIMAMARSSTIEGGPVTTGSANRSQGTVGLIAGIRPVGTNHVPRENITSGPLKYQGNFSTTVGHIGNRMAVGTLESRGLKVVMKEQEERLGTLLIASKFNGHGILRAECSFECATTDVTGARGSNHPDVTVNV